MKLYFVRPGESEAKVLRVFSNRKLTDPLTTLGREQAGQLAEMLMHCGVTKILMSPSPAASQTGEILGERLGLSCSPSDALREYDCGTLEGKSDDKSWGTYAAVQSAWLVGGRLNVRAIGGESFRDMRRRFLPLIDELMATRSQSKDRVVLVGHGGLYHCMLPLILTNIDHSFAMSHPFTEGRMVTADFQHGALICLDWCGTAPPTRSYAPR